MSEIQSQKSDRSIGFLFVGILIVMWGITWPMSKNILAVVSPIWFAFWRFFPAFLCLLMYSLITKQIRLPSKKDLPIILSVSLLQMVGFVILTSFGLKHVPASRSAILAYTTPLWVLPLAILWLRESISKLKIIGFLFGLSGVLVLFNPMNFDWRNREVVLGNGLLILAAMLWAICMVQTRFIRWNLSPVQLLPWQMLIASVVLFVLASYFEPHQSIVWTPQLLGCMFYIGPLATAFGYWMIIEVSRKLPSVTTSLCMLGVPIFGLFSSSVMLGEVISFNMIMAIVLVVTGLVFVIRAK